MTSWITSSGNTQRKWIVGLLLGLAFGAGWFAQAQGPALGIGQDPQGIRGNPTRGRGPRLPGGELVASDSLLVLTARDQQTVWVYSKHHGVWKRQALPAPVQGGIQPIVSELIVVVQDGRDVYAFSGRTGNWDRTRLEAPGEVQVLQDWAYVVGGPRVHAFSAHSGKWESLDPNTK